jgi:hypothetical protein
MSKDVDILMCEMNHEIEQAKAGLGAMTEQYMHLLTDYVKLLKDYAALREKTPPEWWYDLDRDEKQIEMWEDANDM